MFSWARCRIIVLRGRGCRLAALLSKMTSNLDQNVRADCQTERQQECFGVVILECLATDSAEQRGVGRPDGDRERDPTDEPPATLTRDSRRQCQCRASAGDEPGGDQQQPAALLDLMLGPEQSRGELGLAVGAAVEPPAGSEPDLIGGVVAGERSDRAG